MNKSKRLLSVLLCLAMLMSSLSTFALAGEVITETEAGYLSSGSETTSNAVTAGPNPTTNENIDINKLLSRYECYVVDKNATNPYVLEWNGEKYEEGFKVGENVFTDIEKVQQSAQPGAAILIKDIGSQTDLKITLDANFYTEAYNIMPYVIGAKDDQGNALPIAFDGSDWSENPEFTEKTQNVSAIKVETSGKVGLYGFTFSGAVTMTDVDAASNVKLQNVKGILSDNIYPLFNTDALAKNEKSEGSSLEVKNFMLTSSSTTVRKIRLLNEWYVDTVTFDGMYLTPTVNFAQGTNWIKQGKNNQETAMTFKNCNLRGSYGNLCIFQGVETITTPKPSRTLSFRNNIFYDFKFSESALVYVGDAYSHINFVNNRVLSSVPIGLFSDYKDRDKADPCVYTITGNYLNGVDTTLQTKNAGRTISPESVIKENYTYKSFTLSENALGRKVIIDADTDYVCTSYYLDQKMTLLNTDLAPVEIQSVNAKVGKADLNQSIRTIIYNLPKDKAANIEFSVPAGASYKWYTNAKCTKEADLSKVKGGTATTLYVKVTNESVTTHTLVYTIKVITSTTLFSETFKGDDTITKDAFLVTNRNSKVAGYADYTTFNYTLPFDGKTYTFIKGVNAFSNLDDAFEYADVCDIQTPVIYFDYNAPEEEIVISHSAKIYAPNYNVSPYDNKGWTNGADLNDGTGDKAWTYNKAYDKNKRTVAGIKITGVVYPVLEVHGLEFVSYKKVTVTDGVETSAQSGGGINATERNAADKATSFVFANILFNDTLNQPIKFSSTKGIAGDEALFKNMYFQTSYQAGNMQFTANFLPQTTVIDGLFIDFDNLGNGNVPGSWWIKQNNSANTITFKNSNIRNMKQEGSFAFCFQGYASDYVYSANSKIIFDHNILYNFGTGTITKDGKQGLFGFYSYYYANYSDFTLTNNYITAPSGATKTLFAVTGTSDVPSNELNVVVKDNTILGIDGFGLPRAIASTSELSGNYITEVSTADKTMLGKNLVLESGNKVIGTDYYLDYTRKTLNTDIAPESASFKNDPTLVRIDDFNGKILATMETYGEGSLAQLAIKLPTIAAAKWYFDKAMTTEIPASMMEKMTVENCPAYIKVYLKSNPAVYLTYKVHLVSEDTIGASGQGNTFVNNFTDDLIDSTKALLISKEFASTDDGTEVKTTWVGSTEYIFVKGTNLFGTLAEAIEYAKKNNMPDANFLLKDIDGYSGETLLNTWKVRYPGKYFTRNYNKMPYTKGTKQDGSDWKSNVNTGKEDSFNTADGITITWLKFNTAVKGNYEFYGFTLTGVIQDNIDGEDGERSPENDINVKIENLYWKKDRNFAGFYVVNHFQKKYEDENKDGVYEEHISNTHTKDINQYNDSMTIKNVYLDNTSTMGIFAASDNYLWRHLTIDGLYVDHALNSKMETKNRYMTLPYDDYSFTIKNSNLRNFNEKILFQGHNDGFGQFNPNNTDKKSIVLENNIFYKYAMSYTANKFIDMKTRFYNEVTIKNNYIYALAAGDNIFGTDYAGGSEVKDLVVTIKDNVLIGFNTTINVGRDIADGSVAQENYAIATIPSKFPDSKGTQISLVGTNKTITSDDYYIDSDKKYKAGAFIPLEFINENVYEIGGTYYYYVKDLASSGLTSDGVYKELKNASTSKYMYTVKPQSLYSTIPSTQKIAIKTGMDSSLVTLATGTVASWMVQAKTANVDLAEQGIKVILTLSLKSDSTQKEEYTLIFTKNLPIAKLTSVSVGGNVATKRDDGKYAVLLSKDGSDEALTATAQSEGSEIKFYNARNEEVTNVSVGIGETKEYKVVVTKGSATDTQVIVVSRSELGAEDVLIPSINKAEATDTSKWLPAFKEALDDAVRAGWKTAEDALGQKAMEAAAAEIEKAIEAGKVLTRTKYDKLIVSLSKVNNDSGEYCENTFESFKTALKNAKDRFETVASKSAYDKLITDMNGLKSILKKHSFTNYKHVSGTESCVSNGKMTAKCDTKGCPETKTVKETGNYKNDSHVYGEYKYNKDATYQKDGTKTAKCELCGDKKTVTAKGTKLKVAIKDSAKTFKDVDAKGWYKEYVDYAVSFGLMNGIDKTTFAPAKTITRAEFVQVLANMSGVKTTNNNVKTKFSDVKAGAWYAAAVKWASDNGIVNGTSDTTFAPTAVITREQMCVMLVGFAKYQKITLKKAVNKVKFPDDAKISSWAKAEVYACQMAGIVSGKDTGFAPKDTATRAEVSVIVSIFHKDYIK